MKEFILQYWLQVLFGVIVSVLSVSVKHLFTKMKKERTEREEKSKAESAEQSLLKEGVLALLHDRIYLACQYHIQNKGISVQDLDNLEYLYKGYRGLGGNGTGEVLYKRCKALPIVPNEASSEGTV